MPIDPNIPQCTHIKINGVRCGSPALKGKDLCYFHNRVRERHESYIPFLEDANSIQYTIVKIMRAVMDDKIDLKKASVLLYATQIAVSNLKDVRFEPYWENVVRRDPLERALIKYAQQFRKQPQRDALAADTTTAASNTP